MIHGFNNGSLSVLSNKGSWSLVINYIIFPQIQKLQSENSQIRHQTGPSPPPPTNPERAEHPLPAAHRRDRQAFSMYEPGSALKPFGQSTDDISNRLQPFHSGVNIRK